MIETCASKSQNRNKSIQDNRSITSSEDARNGAQFMGIEDNRSQMAKQYKLIDSIKHYTATAQMARVIQCADPNIAWDRLEKDIDTIVGSVKIEPFSQEGDACQILRNISMEINKHIIGIKKMCHQIIQEDDKNILAGMIYRLIIKHIKRFGLNKTVEDNIRRILNVEIKALVDHAFVGGGTPPALTGRHAGIKPDTSTTPGGYGFANIKDKPVSVYCKSQGFSSSLFPLTMNQNHITDLFLAHRMDNTGGKLVLEAHKGAVFVELEGSGDTLYPNIGPQGQDYIFDHPKEDPERKAMRERLETIKNECEPRNDACQHYMGLVQSGKDKKAKMEEAQKEMEAKMEEYLKRDAEIVEKINELRQLVSGFITSCKDKEPGISKENIVIKPEFVIYNKELDELEGKRRELANQLKPSKLSADIDRVKKEIRKEKAQIEEFQARIENISRELSELEKEKVFLMEKLHKPL